MIQLNLKEDFLVVSFFLILRVGFDYKIIKFKKIKLHLFVIIENNEIFRIVNFKIWEETKI